MKIRVEYTGVLDIKSVPSGSGLDVEDGLTIGGLLSQLQIRPEHHKFVVACVNGTKQRHSAPLTAGDRVALSLPLGGG